MTGFACVCTLQCHSHSCSPLSLSLSLLVVEDAGSALSLGRTEGPLPPSSSLDHTFEGKDALNGRRCRIPRPSLSSLIGVV